MTAAVPSVVPHIIRHHLEPYLTEHAIALWWRIHEGRWNAGGEGRRWVLHEALRPGEWLGGGRQPDMAPRYEEGT